MPITINGTGTLTGISVGGLPDGCVATADLAAAAVTQAKRAEDLTLDTVKNSTSGTTVDFTTIPSWAKRVTILFNGVSTNGTSNLQVQLGSGSFLTSGYSSQAVQTSNAPAIATTASSTGLILTGAFSAANLYSGACQISNITGNTWVDSGTLVSSAAGNANFFGGSVALSGVLDRVRITTVNGTDAFDAGSINIMYE